MTLIKNALLVMSLSIPNTKGIRSMFEINGHTPDMFYKEKGKVQRNPTDIPEK